MLVDLKSVRELFWSPVLYHNGSTPPSIHQLLLQSFIHPFDYPSTNHFPLHLFIHPPISEIEIQTRCTSLAKGFTSK